MEHFYQEIGRAGRDGLPSETVLMFSFGDVSTYHRFFEESENGEVRKEKLQRIIQYAQSPICRRKVVLNYFGEELTEDCGNCDVCHNPPETIDGTVIAQKALSAIVRTRQSEPMNMIIDILRGSLKSALRNKNYHHLPTHGVGSELSFFDWQFYIQQMMDMGFVEVEIDKGSKLSITDKARLVLRGEQMVPLVERVEEDRVIKKVKYRKRTKEQVFQEYLEGELRTFRKDMADKQELAPYHVFGDKELASLLDHLPGNIQNLKEISGFGEARVARFGPQICHFINEHVISAEEKKIYKVKGVTYRKTWILIQKGLDVKEMAQHRKLSQDTIYNHLAHLYKEGYEVKIENYIGSEEKNKIVALWKELGKPEELSVIREKIPEMGFGMIRLALADTST
jgi:ATP-dependent DNA helicase RecQ